MYLSGTINDALLSLQRSDIGLMLNPRSGYRRVLGTVPWAFENDCFSATPDLWLSRLNELAEFSASCLFTPVPDIVGDAVATRQRWQQYAAYPAALGFRLAYVSQDGEIGWPAGAGCLFVGGSTHWKLSEASYDLCRAAKRAGLWLHMGRVNSLRRMVAAALAGFDSVDGTFLRFGPDRRLPELCRWLDFVNGPQMTFRFFE